MPNFISILKFEFFILLSQSINVEKSFSFSSNKKPNLQKEYNDDSKIDPNYNYGKKKISLIHIYLLNS